VIYNFTIDAHHGGYPVDAMLRAVVTGTIIYYFGTEN
jgi:hypothetical protein